MVHIDLACSFQYACSNWYGKPVWLTVILVAGIGFVNYVLWKIYGTRGVEVAGFLGGLVNSSVVVTELAKRVHETQGHLADVAYRGIILATAAMMVRNVVLLAILYPQLRALSQLRWRGLEQCSHP